MRTLVAPLVAAESLPHVYSLLLSSLSALAHSVADVDAVGCKEVIAGVDLEQIAGFGERGENEGVVAAERGGEFGAWSAYEDGVG